MYGITIRGVSALIILMVLIVVLSCTNIHGTAKEESMDKNCGATQKHGFHDDAVRVKVEKALEVLGQFPYGYDDAEEVLVRHGDDYLALLRKSLAEELACHGNKRLSRFEKLFYLARVFDRLWEIDQIPENIRFQYYLIMLGDSFSHWRQREKYQYLLLYGCGKDAVQKARKYVAEENTRCLYDKLEGEELYGGDLRRYVAVLIALTDLYRDGAFTFPFLAEALETAVDEKVRRLIVVNMSYVPDKRAIEALCLAYENEKNEDVKHCIFGILQFQFCQHMTSAEYQKFDATTEPEFVAQVHDWYKENKDYIFVTHDAKMADFFINLEVLGGTPQQQRVNYWLVDEQAKRYKVRHEIWIRIHEEKRKSWASLSEKVKEQLIAEAEKKLLEKEQETKSKEQEPEGQKPKEETPKDKQPESENSEPEP